MNNLNINMNNMNQNNINSNQNQEISDLINQNNQMAYQIVMNNNMLTSIMQKSNSNQKSFYDMTSNINFFPGCKGLKVNVTFNSPSGIIINVVVPRDAKMKELLIVFYIKLQILGIDKKFKINEFKDYMFLFNGHRFL